MAFQTIDGVRVWGNPDSGALEQAITCSKTGHVVQTLMMADHHKGYSQPIGGVVVYDGQLSPSGVGYDIACGNKAVRTNVMAKDVMPRIGRLMDDIARSISFGVGRTNNTKVDHGLFDDPDWAVYAAVGKQEHDKLKALARDQLERSAAAIILSIYSRIWSRDGSGSATISAAAASAIRRQAGSSISPREGIFSRTRRGKRWISRLCCWIWTASLATCITAR